MLTWKEVAKEGPGGCVLYDRAKEAKKFGYEYFAFNGRVFSVNNLTQIICLTGDLSGHNNS